MFIYGTVHKTKLIITQNSFKDIKVTIQNETQFEVRHVLSEFCVLNFNIFS